MTTAYAFQLRLASFLGGFTVMAVELVGARVLAPYLGTTITVWSALIGIVLAFLSVGYYAGGKLADRFSSVRQLAGLYCVAGLAIALIPYSAGKMLPILQESGLSLSWQSLFAATLFFGIPSLTLGATSPYITRLALNTVKDSGSTMGTFSALSTVGSIVGTLLTGLVLIQYFGTHNILLGLASLSLCIAALVYPHKKAGVAVILGLLVIVTQGRYMQAVHARNVSNGFVDTDTAYSRVWVYPEMNWDGREIRVMRIGNEYSSAEYTDNGGGLVFDYIKAYQLDSYFFPDPQNILVIGGAAYTYPKELLKRFPNAQVDVVEIDPGVTKLAQEHFNLVPDPRLTIIHEDGRTFLNKNEKKYDLIFGDAFRSVQIPFQLVTQEAFARIAAALTEDGVMIMNVIGGLTGDTSHITQSIVQTAQVSLPEGALFQVYEGIDSASLQNVIFVASKSPLQDDAAGADELQRKYLSLRWNKGWDGELPILTDQFAPVERYARSR
ncbi:MAG TPA: fused MFS/spermidine synthase [Verrucomicrobiae bacterium]|nr:fused MFS/spermidine synthase [Verrucomicrobiae bacterium]